MKPPLLTTLLARQGIYTKNGSVSAYELLYRDGDALIANVNNLDPLSGDAATSSVITQLFANLGMEKVLGDKRAFINFTNNHLIQQVPNLLPKDRVVIEVLETVTINDELISSLTTLHQLGYQIALDDFVFKEEMTPLIAIADIIKVDVLNLHPKQIAEQLKNIKNFHGKLLAEKIENKDQFRACIDLGFDYFQGFFLNKPDPLKGNVITENKIHLLKLLSQLNNEDAQLEKVEEIILQIPKLSYRILRLANSASLYMGKKIESLMDAITQLGLIQIRNWVSLLLLSSVDDVATDLLERTLIRAKMCESLAKVMGYPNPHQAYTVGILSTLDGILNESMSSLLSKIQLSETLNEALLDYKGELGRILKFTMDYEKANFQGLEHHAINEEDFTRSYLQGIEHATSIIDLIKK